MPITLLENRLATHVRGVAIAVLAISGVTAINLTIYAINGPTRGLNWALLLVTMAVAVRFGALAGYTAACLAALAFTIKLAPGNGADPDALGGILALAVGFAGVSLIEHTKAVHRAKPVETPKTWLSHVSDTKAGRVFWAVTPTNDYAADCAEGARMARDLATEIRAGATPALVGWTLQGMAAKGRWSGLEAGFAAEIGRLIADHEARDAGIQGRIVQGEDRREAGAIGQESARGQELPQQSNGRALD